MPFLLRFTRKWTPCRPRAPPATVSSPPRVPSPRRRGRPAPGSSSPPRTRLRSMIFSHAGRPSDWSWRLSGCCERECGQSGRQHASAWLGGTSPTTLASSSAWSVQPSRCSGSRGAAAGRPGRPGQAALVGCLAAGFPAMKIAVQVVEALPAWRTCSSWRRSATSAMVATTRTSSSSKRSRASLAIAVIQQPAQVAPQGSSACSRLTARATSSATMLLVPPDRPQVGVAHQARVAPLLDADPAAHLHGVAGDPSRIAAGARSAG